MENYKKLTIILILFLLTPLLFIPGIYLLSDSYSIGYFFFFLPISCLPVGIYGLTREGAGTLIKVLSILNIIIAVLCFILFILFILYLLFFLETFFQLIFGFLTFLQNIPAVP